MKNTNKKQNLEIISEEDSLFEILKKKAFGYEIIESIEEFSKGKENDELELVKKKITKKYVPPDINAMKVLMEIKSKNERSEFENYTLEDLEKESEKIKQEIIKYENLLKEEENGITKV